MMRTLTVLAVGIVIGATFEYKKTKVMARVAHKLVDAVFGEDDRRRTFPA